MIVKFLLKSSPNAFNLSFDYDIIILSMKEVRKWKNKSLQH